MASFRKLLTIVVMWWSASGPIGCGKIWVLVLMPGLGPTLFLDFIGHLLFQEPQFDLPRITGRDLLTSSPLLEDWMVGLGMSSRLSSSLALWSDCLA